jgi:hypothetical protein
LVDGLPRNARGGVPPGAARSSPGWSTIPQRRRV